MTSGQINLLLLILLCGTVAGFSSGILVNMNRLRVQNHYQIKKMKAEFFKQAKQSKVYTQSFAVKFLKAFVKLAKAQQESERVISS